MAFDLHESLDLSEGGKPRVDREAGVINHVKVLGWSSKRGYRYAPEGVPESLYEGRGVCFDHVAPGKERSVRDTRGWLEGLYRKPDGLYAERLRLAHPAGEDEQRLMSLAEHAPHLVALSHSARAGRWSADGKVVESVAEVDTVDLVRRGATNSGLFEGGIVKRSVKDLIEGLKGTRPGYARGLQEAAQAGVMGADTAMDPPPDAGPGDEAVDHEQALLDAAAAVLKDEGLSSADKLSKIKAILKIVDGGASASTGDEKPAEESLRAVAKLNLLEAANAAGVRLAPSLLESVRPDLTAEGARKLVAEFGTPAGAGGKPGARSAAPPAPAASGKKPGDGTPVQEGVPAGLDAKAKARWAREGV